MPLNVDTIAEYESLPPERFVVLPENEFRDTMLQIDKVLAKFSTWGLNPKNVSLADFDVIFYVSKPDHPNPGKPVPQHLIRVYMLAEHKFTGKQVAVDVFLIQARGAYPTASELIALSERGEE